MRERWRGAEVGLQVEGELLLRRPGGDGGGGELGWDRTWREEDGGKNREWKYSHKEICHGEDCNTPGKT